MEPTRTIWWEQDSVAVIDQRHLPHRLVIDQWRSVGDARRGIAEMQVRGAPLIGVAAAHGIALAAADSAADVHLDSSARSLLAARPTAVNLRWAVEHMMRIVTAAPPDERRDLARAAAQEMADHDADACRRIGEHGVPLLRAVGGWPGRTRPVQVLTHCNAGWLACIEWGTALAPVYRAQRRGLDLHVWVSETRPRNQGAALTAWELAQARVPHTVVVDNAAGHLLRTGQVDLVIVGADRVAANGDTANKIGTYLKAVAAHDCGVPFYVALPASTFDVTTPDGDSIPIEERSPDEVLELAGERLAPASSTARNWGFDITPARLVTSFVTDRGIVAPSAGALREALV